MHVRLIGIFFLFVSDSFVNSQEWTLSRDVKEIRIGVIGDVHSEKSSLVHRYITGTFLHVSKMILRSSDRILFLLL